MESSRHILVIEDNSSDAYIIQIAVAEAGLTAEFTVLEDGEQALRYIQQAQPAIHGIDLIIMDINLPKYSAGCLLEAYQASAFASIPIIVMSSSNSKPDREMVCRFTPHYFRKPIDLEGFLKIGPLIQSVLLVDEALTIP